MGAGTWENRVRVGGGGGVVREAGSWIPKVAGTGRS